MATTSIVLTVVADDHPGIVEDLSDALATHDGNWTESSMMTLAGKFAGDPSVADIADDLEIGLVLALAAVALPLAGIEVRVAGIGAQEAARLGCGGDGIEHSGFHCAQVVHTNMRSLRDFLQS